MGIGEAFHGLFMTDEERRKEKTRHRRRIVRKLDDVISRVDYLMLNLSKQQEVAWNTAKQRLAGGNKTLAKQSLNQYLALETQIDKLGTRQCVFLDFKTKAEMLDIDTTVATVMSAIGTEFKVDVDDIMDKVGEGTENITDLASLNQFWERTFQSSMNEAELQSADTPSFDDMFSKLEAATAIDIGSGSSTNTVKMPINDVQAKLDAIKGSSEK